MPNQGRLKEILQDRLEKDDVFPFQCAMCGACCGHRSEPIVINGYDLFRVAKFLGRPVPEVAFEYTECYLGHTTHFPVVVIKEKEDGNCGFLKDGKCLVHAAKPNVCALFPLGRAFNTESNEFFYVWSGGCSNSIQDNPKEWTVQEWLDIFHIEESDSMGRAWNEMATEIVEYTSDIPKQAISQDIFDILAHILYLGYDINKPYLEQIQTIKDTVFRQIILLLQSQRK